MTTRNFDQLEKNLGVVFVNKELLNQALVHRSYLNEKMGKNLGSNERLEFLGDAVLSYVISKWLYQSYPDYPEGNLTDLRSNLVRTNSLAKLSEVAGVGECLLLSRGEKDSGGQTNTTLLANAFEAIIGALELDQGLQTVERFVKSQFSDQVLELVKLGELKDYKSLLQEKLQAQMKESPVYKTLKEEGPDHAKTFTIGVFDRDRLLAQGMGKSKQQAEQEAAQNAYEKIT